MGKLLPTDLIYNRDGGVYHLSLIPEQVADHIILVGDPGRVDVIAGLLDRIESRTSNREFVCVTGTYKGNRVTALSTGIGTDNMEIVITELDAMVSHPGKTVAGLEGGRILRLIRVGTSGTIQKDIKPGTFVLSRSAVGLDGLLHFYRNSEGVRDTELEEALSLALDYPADLPVPYAVSASPSLLSLFAGSRLFQGVTLSAPGFYAPQGREVRLELRYPHLNKRFAAFRFNDQRILNYEMECSVLYGLSGMLGHEALTLCMVLANRATGELYTEYSKGMKTLIRLVLDHLPFNGS